MHKIPSPAPAAAGAHQSSNPNLVTPGLSSESGAQGEDGWERMTAEARSIQMRHLDDHHGDVYHAMQSLVVKHGFRSSAPIMQPIPQPAAADGGVRERNSTHHVHRGPESLPCYCAATEDHQIGEESRKGEALARRFHETYERLAPSFGYETRTETRAFDPTTPNGRLMIAVCEQIEAALSSHRQAGDDLSKFRELAERWRIDAEGGQSIYDIYNQYGTGMNKCADDLIAMVEKGAGS